MSEESVQKMSRALQVLRKNHQRTQGRFDSRAGSTEGSCRRYIADINFCVKFLQRMLGETKGQLRIQTTWSKMAHCHVEPANVGFYKVLTASPIARTYMERIEKTLYKGKTADGHDVPDAEATLADEPEEEAIEGDIYPNDSEGTDVLHAAIGSDSEDGEDLNEILAEDSDAEAQGEQSLVVQAVPPVGGRMSKRRKGTPPDPSTDSSSSGQSCGSWTGEDTPFAVIAAENRGQNAAAAVSVVQEAPTLDEEATVVAQGLCSSSAGEAVATPTSDSDEDCPLRHAATFRARKWCEKHKPMSGEGKEDYLERVVQIALEGEKMGVGKRRLTSDLPRKSIIHSEVRAVARAYYAKHRNLPEPKPTKIIRHEDFPKKGRNYLVTYYEPGYVVQSDTWVPEDAVMQWPELISSYMAVRSTHTARVCCLFDSVHADLPNLACLGFKRTKKLSLESQC